ncbi:MAG: MFS transporter, partial [Deltaproteobacteria bacterium]|nr:MFS transporter [Deltaproteobacteria bacterium]
MSRLPTRLIVTVAVLEFVSGTPYGLVNDFVPVWMREQGASLEAVGALSALAMPWNLKAFWGPLVDRYLGFRTWIIGALLGIGTVTLAGPWLG